MYSSVVNYFIVNSRRRCWTSAPHMLLMLAACSAITTWTQNVSGEISNHIEEVPMKERSSVDSSGPKLLEKSIASVSDLKSNDSEKLRQSRYLRTMPPSSLPYRSKQQRSSVSASAAAAAAAAADDDLRHFGKMFKYYAVPYDGGGGKYSGRGPESLSPLPSRQPLMPKTRYRYHKDEVHYAPAAAARNKWRLRGGGGGLSHEGFSSHAAFGSDHLVPYDDYYEGGHSTEATLEDDDDGGGGFYDGSNNEDDQRDNWYLENYRKLQAQKQRQPAYEDTEVALSLQHTVGKRLPFTSHERDNPEHFGPNMASAMVAFGGGGNSRYHKYNKLNRGRGEAGPSLSAGEWLGGKRGGNVNSLTKQHHHRLPRPALSSSLSSYNFNSPPQPHKYSPFELDESHHRFKLDHTPPRHPSMNFHHDMHDDQNEKHERDREHENALKFHLNRRRNKQRLRDRDRERVKYSPSLFGGGEDDEDVDQVANVYESSSDVAHDHENVISTSSARRPLSGPSVYEDDVVYSSRYRNKQAAAAAGGATDDVNVDEADPSRLFVNYHDHDQTAAGGTLSSIKKSKFAISNDGRKSNTASSSMVSDEIYEDEEDDRDNDAATAVNKNYSLKKSNRKVSKSTGSFVSASSTPSPTGSFSASSPYSVRKVNNRRISVTTTPTTPPPTSSTASTTTMDLDDGWHLQTSHSYGGGSVVDAETDMNSYSNAEEAAGGGGDFKSQSHFQSDGISASELIAYMSASPSEPVVNKQDRYTRPNSLGYPFVRTFSEQHDKLKSKYYHHSPLPSINDQDFEINLDQYGYRRRRRRR